VDMEILSAMTNKKKKNYGLQQQGCSKSLSFRQEAVSAFARTTNVNDRTTTYSGSTYVTVLCLGQASKEQGVKSLWIIPPVTHVWGRGGREVKLNTGYITVDIDISKTL
jgi:hypothetical protein